MIRTLLRYGALAGTVVLAGCELGVKNPNDPTTIEVFATPRDIESLVGSYYRRWHAGLYGTLSNIWGVANVMSFENYSSLANNGQNARAGIPRPANDNSLGNVLAEEQHRVYFRHGEVNRVASNSLVEMEKASFDLGSSAANARAKAFAEFLRGISLGYIAMFYDSSAIISPGMSTAAADCLPNDEGVCVGALRGYREVMDSALAALQRSLDTTNKTVTGSGGFPIPTAWINSTTSLTVAEFSRLIRSYRARFRANVARTPAERADISAGGIVDWTAVIADAAAGITADHDNITNTSTGPFKTWVAQYMLGGGLWHQMTPFVIGMADVSGSYASWIATPLGQRGATGGFFMITPDLRFPQGDSRADQQLDFAITSCSAASTPCERYFVNRPSSRDQFAGLGWGFSNYDHVRFYPWAVAGDGTSQNGRVVFFTKAELDLLAAEGHLRKAAPDYGAAAALINVTRTRGMSSTTPIVATGGGLPAITVFDATTAVPGGAACVPKVPVGPNFDTIACGNMMEALKYEKRIETAYTHFGAWYLDMRGWGDLAQGTPLHWAPPYQDLLAREKAVYSTGTGTSGGMAAAKGSYGW
jgi:hypothetical protein